MTTNAIRTFKSTDQLLTRATKPRTWLWDHFLTPGKLTLFTSPAKDGKTTLISQVVAAMQSGGRIIDSEVKPCRVVIATEEDDDDWGERCQLLKEHGLMGDATHIEWSTDPFPANATWDDWELFVLSLEEKPADLYVIDPLSNFLPAYAENHPTTVRRAFDRLRQLSRTMHASVLPIHHPSEGAKGWFNCRGTGALKAYVDILMELKRLPNAGLMDRRRVLSSIGRYPPAIVRTIELNEAGTANTVLANVPPADSFEIGWTGLRITLEDATYRLGRAEILKEWPPDYDKPSRTTLRDWLERAVAGHLIERFGKGRCSSPYRYALPGRKFDRFDFGQSICDPDEMDREKYG